MIAVITETGTQKSNKILFYSIEYIMYFIIILFQTQHDVLYTNVNIIHLRMV